MTIEQTSHDPSGWPRALRCRLMRTIRQFHRSERGATLTEFIVVLPVFIIVFVAILRFGILQSTTVQLKMSATKGVWEKAVPVQQQRAPANQQRFTDPSDASSESYSNIQEAGIDRTFSDSADEAMVDGIRNGTIGEAGAALQDTGVAPLAELQLPPSANGSIQRDAHDILERQNTTYQNSPTYAEQVLDDQDSRADSGPPAARSPLNNMGLTPSNNNTQTNAAYAAGVRYGMVQATRKPSPGTLSDIPSVDAGHLETGYNTLVAPYPMVDDGSSQINRPIGTARRYMRPETPFNLVYGLDFAP